MVTRDLFTNVASHTQPLPKSPIPVDLFLTSSATHAGTETLFPSSTGERGRGTTKSNHINFLIWQGKKTMCYYITKSWARVHCKNHIPVSRTIRELQNQPLTLQTNWGCTPKAIYYLLSEAQDLEFIAFTFGPTQQYSCSKLYSTGKVTMIINRKH